MKIKRTAMVPGAVTALMAIPEANGATYVKAAQNDYTGDGRADFALFRPSTGTWIIQGLPNVNWGRAGDIPLPSDYDGDGKTDRAVYRPTTHQLWVYSKPAINGVGINGDVVAR